MKFRLFRWAVTAAVGAAAAYFFDPAMGGERRRRMKARWGSLTSTPGPRESGQEALARVARRPGGTT